VPNDGQVYNYVQAGLLFYRDDDNYIKLDRDSIWETRQTEYAKEIKPFRPATRATATRWWEPQARPPGCASCAGDGTVWNYTSQ
jgi:hypothetical protein